MHDATPSNDPFHQQLYGGPIDISQQAISDKLIPVLIVVDKSPDERTGLSREISMELNLKTCTRDMFESMNAGVHFDRLT